jgi:lytic cellulose monooxygenase (C1-hydroxylating)
LIKQNNSWSLTIPSDIKPGRYVVRHELIALHFGFSGNAKGAGTASSSAQLYPICLNVDITGDGNAEPAGVTFPGGYQPNDPGILNNIYYGPNAYVS